MVDIIIGAIEPITPSKSQPTPSGAPVEAELLHIREPRQRVIGPRARNDDANPARTRSGAG